MDNVDFQVLETALAWRRAAHPVALLTVVGTWGSAPRPPGAMLAIRDDGRLAGSVSGGCVEDDLIERMRTGRFSAMPAEEIVYGVSHGEANRFGLPCGGTLRLVQEAVGDPSWIAELLGRTARHEMVARVLDMSTGDIRLDVAARDERLAFDGRVLRTIHGPRWRLFVIGAGQLGRYLAQMAQALDFQVVVCDPREEYAAAWDLPNAALDTRMPDDALLALEPDPHTAIVAVTHDPKLDDLALLEALKSDAFYIGALGSRRNTAARRERLAQFDLVPAQIERLHGPVGLRIGSRTPPEIAIAILAELLAVRNGVPAEAGD
ncbi:MAG: XdhC family protein [Burkholderiaceae bacterium]